jgi:heme oxygenase
MTELSTPVVNGLPPLLLALRQGTREVHAAIEAVPALSVLITPALTVPAYVAALLGQARFHAAMQEALPAHLQRLGIDWPMPSMALAAARADLAHYGVAPPRPVRAPGRWAGHGALGALYALEGSLLGGRVIGRHIAKNLGVTETQGGAFFCGTTADDARTRWRALCAVFQAAPDAVHASAVAGARAAFGFFLHCVDPAAAAGPRTAASSSLSGATAPLAPGETAQL